MHNLYYPYNFYINSDSPKEKAITEDSYAQLNTKLTIERFYELGNYRKTKETLSKKKLEEVTREYIE